MTSEQYRNLKEEAQHRETWNHWWSEPARGQRRSHRKFPKITTQQQWYRRAARQIYDDGGGAPINKSRRRRPKIVGGGGAARPAHGSTYNRPTTWVTSSTSRRFLAR